MRLETTIIVRCISSQLAGYTCDQLLYLASNNNFKELITSNYTFCTTYTKVKNNKVVCYKFPQEYNSSNCIG